MKDAPNTHVLVVDDQSGFRELLKRMLGPVGYDVRTATDAHEALASIADAPPAVAILDVHMPGPDGLWLANQIRAGSPKTAIVLATSDDAVPPTESLRKGVVAYIVKPLQRDAVLTAVADAFKWFAAESKLDLSRLAVPMHVPVAPDHVEPTVDSRPAPRVRQRTPSRHISAGLLLLVVMLTAAAAIGLYRRRTPVRAVDVIAAASGAVNVLDASGRPFMQGSGFFVTPDTFVTNHHVVNGGTRATIAMAVTGRVLEVNGLLASDRQHDLVLLRTSAAVAGHLSLNVAPPALGETILVYGAPRGLAGTLSQGIVSAHRVERDLLQISAPISPGSSGSPVVTSDGEVVGVVAGSRMDGQGLNFAVPAVHVRNLLDNAQAVRPLIAAGRGGGDDLERNQLIGLVKSVTLFASEPYVAVRDRLRATYVNSMPAAEATSMAERVALRNSTTTLSFDREGRVIEKILGDDLTKMRYEYDDEGRLKTQIDAEGDRSTMQWSFAPVGPLVVEAVTRDSRGASRRRIAYAEDGRLLSDDTWAAERQVASVRWTYHDVQWPTPVTVPENGLTYVSSGQPRAGQEEHDALGNLIRQKGADGTEVLFDYKFDAQGNWLSRETTRVDSNGARSVIRRERREIHYWDR